MSQRSWPRPTLYLSVYRPVHAQSTVRGSSYESGKLLVRQAGLGLEVPDVADRYVSTLSVLRRARDNVACPHNGLLSVI